MNTIINKIEAIVSKEVVADVTDLASATARMGKAATHATTSTAAMTMETAAATTELYSEVVSDIRSHVPKAGEVGAAYDSMKSSISDFLKPSVKKLAVDPTVVSEQ